MFFERWRRVDNRGLRKAVRCLVVVSAFLLNSQDGHAAVMSHGPMVGGVTDTSARVLTRTDASASVQVAYSTEGALSNPMVTGPVTTTDATDFTAILDLSGLQPLTRYYYTVWVDGVSQLTAPYPSFTTFPVRGTPVSFQFVVFSDQVSITKFTNLPAPVYATAAAENPAFVLQIGDFDHRLNSQLDTLIDQRSMWKDLLNPSFAAPRDFLKSISPRFPLFHVWDDRDFGGDDSNKTFTAKAFALQAFLEYFPTAALGNPAAGVWQKFQYGQADFFLLDLRSQRDPDNDSDNADKSLLDGDLIPNGQKEWLKDQLLTSTADWKFIISSVPFNPTSKPDDSWGAFTTEHGELVDFIRSHGITGVIFFSGDLHSGGGIDNGQNSGFPELSVPATSVSPNQVSVGVTTTTPGVWSEGLITDARVLGDSDNSGYALIMVTADPPQVQLEAKGVNGNVRKSLIVTLTNQSPSAAFNAIPTSGQAPLTVSFDGSASSDPDGTIASYDWDFGDGSIGTGVTVSHTYGAQGSYIATLTVTDNAGAGASASVTITVTDNQTPTAVLNATPASGQAPLTVSFDGSGSSDPNGSIVSYDWSFGDGTTGTGAMAIHTYAAAGSYLATLTVTDNDGVVASASIIIVANADTVTIIRAIWQSSVNILTVTATSSAGGSVTLTAEGFGALSYNATTGDHSGRFRNVTANPGTVTVTSTGGGSAMAAVRTR